MEEEAVLEVVSQVVTQEIIVSLIVILHKEAVLEVVEVTEDLEGLAVEMEGQMVLVVLLEEVVLLDRETMAVDMAVLMVDLEAVEKVALEAEAEAVQEVVLAQVQFLVQIQAMPKVVKAVLFLEQVVLVVGRDLTGQPILDMVLTEEMIVPDILAVLEEAV